MLDRVGNVSGVNINTDGPLSPIASFKTAKSVIFSNNSNTPPFKKDRSKLKSALFSKEKEEEKEDGDLEELSEYLCASGIISSNPPYAQYKGLTIDTAKTSKYVKDDLTELKNALLGESVFQDCTAPKNSGSIISPNIQYPTPVKGQLITFESLFNSLLRVPYVLLLIAATFRGGGPFKMIGMEEIECLINKNNSAALEDIYNRCPIYRSFNLSSSADLPDLSTSKDDHLLMALLHHAIIMLMMMDF